MECIKAPFSLRKGGSLMDKKEVISTSVTDEALLKYLNDNGIINVSDLVAELEMKKRIEILSNFSIWKASDGRYKARVCEPDNPRRIISSIKKEDLENKLIKWYEEHNSMTFKACFEHYQKYCVEEGIVEKQSADRREQDFKKYLANTAIADMDITLITEKDVKAVVRGIAKDYRGSIDVKRFGEVKGLINKTFNYARSELDIDCIDTRHILSAMEFNYKKFRKPKKNNQVFFPDEIPMIVQAIIDKHGDQMTYMGILCMLTTALRLGELAALKTTDFLDEEQLMIQREEIKYKDDNGKSVMAVVDHVKNEASETVILLTSDARKVLNHVWQIRKDRGIESEWLFAHDDGRRLTRRAFDNAIRNLCKELGIKERSCHKLRKTFGSWYISQPGITPQDVQIFMRHACLQTTLEHYTYTMKREKEIRSKMDEFSILGRISW